MTPQPHVWRPGALFGFRFAFCYVALFAAYKFGQNIPIYQTAVHPVVQWLAFHILRLPTSLSFGISGSGDKTSDWVTLFFNVVAAATGALVWWGFDRRRHDYEHLYGWLRLFVRLLLGTILIEYGMIKVIPEQFGPLTLSRIAVTFGALSPMLLLWNFMAASPGYTVFTGVIEASAGILLLVPRLSLLGALIAAAAMTNVLALNLFYDVPVKLFSFHLLVFAVFIIAPDARRVALVLFHAPTISEAHPARLSRNDRIERFFRWAPLVLAVALAVSTGVEAVRQRAQSFAQIDEKAPFYGVWIVDEFTPPPHQSKLYRDQRWERLIFDSSTMLSIISADGRLQYCIVGIDQKSRKLELRSYDRNLMGSFAYEQTVTEELALKGTLYGLPFRASMHRFHESQYPLLRGGIHWIKEYAN